MAGEALTRANEHESTKPGHTTVGDESGFLYTCLDCGWDSTMHPAVTPKMDQCRVTTMVGHVEFICIHRVHDDGKKQDQWARSGQPARWRRHHFVRRYPHGDH